MKRLFNEALIRWHRWRMEANYGYNRDAAIRHMHAMYQRIKARGI